MSKFLKALEQAQRDRALAKQGHGARVPAAPPAAAPAAPPPPPVGPPPVDAAPPRPGVPPSPSATQTAFRRPPIARQPVDIPDGVDDHLVSLVTPSAFEAEQYRALRYLVEQRHRGDNLSVIAISSAAVGDGKTMTAINLAGTLGQAPEVRVLLIEADLRRPAVSALLGFGRGSHPGLVDAILDRNLTLSDVALTPSPFNLNVVLAGQTPPSPYEVLKSPRLGELLDEARTQYDYVVIDTPPMVSVQDCRVIARWVDGVILVVAAHQTPKRLLEEALNVVDPSKMLGFVFNGDDQSLARLYSSHRAAYTPAPRDTKRGWGRRMRKVGESFASPDRRRTSAESLEGETE